MEKTAWQNSLIEDNGRLKRVYNAKYDWGDVPEKIIEAERIIREAYFETQRLGVRISHIFSDDNEMLSLEDLRYYE